MYVSCVRYALCTQWLLRRADRSFIGVLTGVCMCVCVCLSVCHLTVWAVVPQNISSCCINLDVVISMLIIQLPRISSPDSGRMLQPMTAHYAFRQQNSPALPLLSPIYKLSPGLSPC